jgi:hypothetical protein
LEKLFLDFSANHSDDDQSALGTNVAFDVADIGAVITAPLQERRCRI